MKINQSLIKKFFYKGEVRDYCPKCIYSESIAKTHNRTTLSMLCGSYFETLCLGGGANGSETIDLPRKKLTSKQILAGQTIGDKKIDQIRIEQQHLNFERLCGTWQINVQKNCNTQVQIAKYYSKNDNIILTSELDIFPSTILLPERGLKLAVHDLKATKMFTDFGEYCWASPENIDKIQGFMYHYLIRDIDLELNREIYPDSKIHSLLTGPILKQIQEVEPLFFFWVFNYGEKELKNKIIEVEYNALAQKELLESIRKTVEEINKNERRGWNVVNPTENNCNFCPVIECPNKVIFKQETEHKSFETI